MAQLPWKKALGQIFPLLPGEQEMSGRRTEVWKKCEQISDSTESMPASHVTSRLKKISRSKCNMELVLCRLDWDRRSTEQPRSDESNTGITLT